MQGAPLPARPASSAVQPTRVRPGGFRRALGARFAGAVYTLCAGVYRHLLRHHRITREARAQHPEERLQKNRARHLGLADATILEHDRHLANAIAALPEDVGHLDLERVALRANLAQIERAQRLGPVAAVAAGTIVHRHAKHGAGEDVAAPADELAQRRPVGRAAPSNVARANHQVRPLARLEEVRQIARIVRKVGIHLEDQIVAVRDGILEAFDVGGAEAELAGTMQHVYLWLPRTERVDDLSGAVWRVIVYDQQVGCRHEAQNILDQADDILPLVVGWDDDE